MLTACSTRDISIFVPTTPEIGHTIHRVTFEPQKVPYPQRSENISSLDRTMGLFRSLLLLPSCPPQHNAHTQDTNIQHKDDVFSKRPQKQIARLLWRPRAINPSFPSCPVRTASTLFPYPRCCVAFRVSQHLFNFEDRSANKLFFSSNPVISDVSKNTTAEFGTGENCEIELTPYEQAIL